MLKRAKCVMQKKDVMNVFFSKNVSPKLVIESLKVAKTPNKLDGWIPKRTSQCC